MVTEQAHTHTDALSDHSGLKGSPAHISGIHVDFFFIVKFVLDCERGPAVDGTPPYCSSVFSQNIKSLNKLLSCCFVLHVW